MRFIEQDNKLDIKNIDTQILEKPSRHGPLLPDSIRGILVGASSSGKTNVMINLLTHINGLKFENVYIYSKTLNQEKYVLLKQIFDGIKEANLYTFTVANDVIKPQLTKPNSIFIFDDIICDIQTPIREYFSMGRHFGANSIFFLNQSYSKILKQQVRDNCNFLIIFKQDDRNLGHIFHDHCSTDFLDFSEFRKLCYSCWNHDSYGFIVIDKTRNMNDGRYRRGFDVYISLDIAK